VKRSEQREGARADEMRFESERESERLWSPVGDRHTDDDDNELMK
jgi:hypothetical protein